ncbi:AglZ/HisF2 family acetamidino modification protein [Vibrio cholerae]
MLRPRVIPCLLIQDNGLVKTVNFKSAKYVGDPINAVKIFNEKEVDELIVLDIDASASGKSPDLNLIKILAGECRMPFCYGGGISTLEQAKKIISLGVEKVAISSAAIENPKLIKEISAVVGKQSVVVVLDVKKKFLSSKYEVWIHNGKKNTKKCPIELAKSFVEHGAGEIVLNSIDNDGVMKGFDLTIAKQVRETIDVPFTILGGAGNTEHFSEAVAALGTVGVSAGSFFVFKGIYKAVLISYLTQEFRTQLAKISFRGNV